ncbi:hypothetical protein Cri9333_0397 [Crinalium epipsammum PCC 9333]|uniref:Uncharacterized protein n=1 Tax=Crinalium epipsammum PCC 9333 TaxID=1173022 RepID=K9VTT9_9CYAN|nr:DUF6753 family protein [Crinalium epipsammum]AFZ11371.1 hypothetical protein Cri9333_0397 [Crinalium epipsammum PCC 9333]
MTGKSEELDEFSEQLIDYALENQSDEFKSKVLAIAYKAKVQPDDPLFLVLLATGQLELMLKRAPNSIELKFNNSLIALQDKLAAYEKAAVMSQTAAISQAVTSLVHKSAVVQREVQSSQPLEEFYDVAEKPSRRGFDLGSLLKAVPSGLFFLCAVGIGYLLGLTVPTYLQGGYAGTVKLTQKQFEALKWAESKDGQYAKDFMKWNASLLEGNPGNRDCEQEAKRMGVTLEIQGRKASNGFCVLWTQPSKNRKFVQAKTK